MRLLTNTLLTLSLVSCAVGPDYKKPEMKNPMRYRYVDQSAKVLVKDKWWEGFNDSRLNRLIDMGFEGNYDLKIALSRIEEALLFYGFKKKDMFPLLNIQGGAQRGNYSNGVAYTTTSENSFIASSFSWEIDFWGKLRRANEAAKSQLLSSRYGYDSVKLQLASSIATTYFELLKFNLQLSISKETVQTRQESYRIIRARYKKGTVPSIDLNQAEAQLYFAKAAVPQFERAVVTTENLLRILLGKNPGKISITQDEDILKSFKPPAIPVGLPSNLLERRPDIAQQLMLVKAANANVGVAKASLFPTISLTGTGGTATNDLSVIGENFAWNLGVGLVGPLFQWGKNLDNLDISKEQYKQVVYTYKKSVINAFKDVEDSLTAVDTYSRESEQLTDQVIALRKAAKTSMRRYQSGVTSFLEVLDSQRALFESEINFVDVKQSRVSAYVNLYKSLGGGWEMPKPEEKKEEVKDGSKKAN